MINNKIISIIVPIYNRASFLPACIESIVNQSYPHLDIILIDDGSTDNSLEICKRYAKDDKRITVINIPNSGVSTARNTGIRQAKGDFIQFVDSDDKIKSDMCKILIQEQQKNNADLVICGFDNVDINAKHLYYQCIQNSIDDLRVFFDSFADLLEQNLIYSPVNKLYKKSIIQAHSLLFPTRFNIAEDGLFNIEYLRYIQNIKVIPQDLYIYVHYQSENRLTQKLHSNYFYIHKILFTNLIILLSEKNMYHKKNKKMIKKKYAYMISTGINKLKKDNKKNQYTDVLPHLIPNLFFHTSCSGIYAYSKKNEAYIYIKKHNNGLKKIYGIFKIICWQCIEIYCILIYFITGRQY